MTDAPAAKRRFSAPIAAQIVALLICGVAVGQIVTLLIVFLTPPPRPSAYRISEIADALDGQIVKPRDGRPLVLAVSAPPAADNDAHHAFANAARLELADLLKVSDDRVRLSIDRPMGPFLGASVLSLRGRPMGPPGAAGGPNGRPFGGDWRHPPGFGMASGAEPIFGDFKAALRQSSGEWVVVAPAPEPFPTAWQSRLIVWFLACLAVLAPAGYLFARRLVAPIGAFARAADRLGRDPSAPQLELSGPAEIGTAARAFNEMQARLKRYIEDRTSMIGAISHDLRTPLTRIRFKIESAEPALRASVGSDLDQMEAMISGVLSFVRDASYARDRTAIDLLSVLECAVDDARASGAETDLSSSGQPTVDGDALALRRLFANLIDNAVKYGHRVRVRLYADGPTAVTEVTDDGPGLPSSELERVFEPFYRAEPSRNRETGGIGLGLAVARSIARAHGGDVRLQSGTSGLTATVRLPTTAIPGRRADITPAPSLSPSVP
jgi:two-component system, OmpR family, sensor kinase